MDQLVKINLLAEGVARNDLSPVILPTLSESETEQLGSVLGAYLQRGDIVVLTGELGTGKTVLARGIASGAGATGYVASPTFTIVREYAGQIPVYHVDLYRLAPDEAEELGLEELFDAGITVIEWAERAPVLLRPPLLRVALAFGNGPEERIITLSAEGQGPETALQAIDRERRAAAGR